MRLLIQPRPPDVRGRGMTAELSDRTPCLPDSRRVAYRPGWLLILARNVSLGKLGRMRPRQMRTTQARSRPTRARSPIRYLSSGPIYERYVDGEHPFCMAELMLATTPVAVQIG